MNVDITRFATIVLTYGMNDVSCIAFYYKIAIVLFTAVQTFRRTEIKMALLENSETCDNSFPYKLVAQANI